MGFKSRDNKAEIAGKAPGTLSINPWWFMRTQTLLFSALVSLALALVNFFSFFSVTFVSRPSASFLGAGDNGRTEHEQNEDENNNKEGPS